jgi:hypothetical protein
MKLIFGFEDVPYAVRYSHESPILASIKKRRPKKLSQPQEAYGQGKTSGQVATELESKYHLVETFYTFEEDEIVKDFQGAYANALDLGMWGQSWEPVWDPSIKYEGRFRRALSQRKFDGLIHGVPTQAALRGVSHLRQDPYAGKTSRPSFIDTSLYQRSFKAWTEV